MAKQVCYEDVEVGSEVASLAKIATTRMLVQWAGASGDFNPLHYDEDFAKAMGVGAPIVHGALKRAWGAIDDRLDWRGWETQETVLPVPRYGLSPEDDDDGRAS